MKKTKVKDVEYVEVTPETIETVVEPEVETEVETVVEPEVETEVETVVEPEVETEVETVVEPDVDNIPDPEKCVEGVLINCTRLNVRKEPKANAKVVKVIDTKTRFMINLDASTEDFYYVYSLEGFEGYCNKNFLQVK